jgi:hypothetical protein
MIFYVSIFTGILYVALLLFSIRAYCVFDKRDAAVGWIAVSIHGILFYMVFSYIYLNNEMVDPSPIAGFTLAQFFNYWSIALRTHTVLFGISILWAQIERLKIRGKI